MFNAASSILNHYITIDDRDLWRFDIYSIETQRGKNPEDLYYLCNVRNSWYIVFETDYTSSLQSAAKEAADIFGADGIQLLHWLTKKDEHNQPGTLPLEAADDKSQRDKLVLGIEGTYLRCAVLVVKVPGPGLKRYDPNAYGYAK